LRYRVRWGPVDRTDRAEKHDVARTRLGSAFQQQDRATMIHSLVLGIIPERGICCRVNDDIDTPDQVMPSGSLKVTMNPTDAAIFRRRRAAYSASAEAEDEFNGRTFQQLDQ
jgi:hypothetical protein